MSTLVRSARLIVLILALAVTPVPAAEAGGVPDTPAVSWVSVIPGPGAEIIEFIQRLPQDPNPLGVRAANLRVKAYPASLSSTSFKSLDGTPLAGSLGMHRDGKPRPGVVLVPGLARIRNLKPMVELADLLLRNGWHVLAIDVRGQGESRLLSNAMISFGWKEADDVLGAARYLRETSQATSIAVIGFSNGGRSLVKAMAQDGGERIAAGIAVSAPLAATDPVRPPEPGVSPTPIQRFFLDFLGTGSYYEYYERAARSYGVDLRTLEAEIRVDHEISRIRAPLLVLHALDDFFWRSAIRAGAHDGGASSLAYRDSVKEHPHVRTLVVDRRNHAGALYLSDPHWFGLMVMSYLKHWQAREAEHVTVAMPSLDVLAEGVLSGQAATYRFVVRNHGPRTVGPLDVHLDLPEGALLGHCWVGVEGLGRCGKDGRRLSWTIPRLSGGKTTAGPFVAVVDVSTLPPGQFAASVAVDQQGVLAQQLTLERK